MYNPDNRPTRLMYDIIQLVLGSDSQFWGYSDMFEFTHLDLPVLFFFVI